VIETEMDGFDGSQVQERPYTDFGGSASDNANGYLGHRTILGIGNSALGRAHMPRRLQTYQRNGSG